MWGNSRPQPYFGALDGTLEQWARRVRIEYEQLYKNGRKRMVSAQYTNELDILEATGMDYWQIQQQPAQYIDELIIRLSKRATTKRLT